MLDEIFRSKLTVQLRNRISRIRRLHDNASMKVLARRIARELKIAKHYGVYEPEISRVWPCKGNNRELELSLFAKRHGWRLRFFKDGFCAIFDKAPSR